MDTKVEKTGNKIALFEWKEVRKIIHNDEWWFSVVDIIWVLNVSGREARKYWSDLKKKIFEEWYIEVSEQIGQLKLLASDNKMRLTNEWDKRDWWWVWYWILTNEVYKAYSWMIQ